MDREQQELSVCTVAVNAVRPDLFAYMVAMDREEQELSMCTVAVDRGQPDFFRLKAESSVYSWEGLPEFWRSEGWCPGLCATAWDE
jgi:hypothetical protein